MKRYEQDDYDDPSGEDNRVALWVQFAFVVGFLGIVAGILFALYKVII